MDLHIRVPLNVTNRTLELFILLVIPCFISCPLFSYVNNGHVIRTLQSRLWSNYPHTICSVCINFLNFVLFKVERQIFEKLYWQFYLLSEFLPEENRRRHIFPYFDFM